MPSRKWLTWLPTLEVGTRWSAQSADCRLEGCGGGKDWRPFGQTPDTLTRLVYRCDLGRERVEILKAHCEQETRSSKIWNFHCFVFIIIKISLKQKKCCFVFTCYIKKKIFLSSIAKSSSLLPRHFRHFSSWYKGAETQHVHLLLQLVPRETTEWTLIREEETGSCSACFLSSSLQ